MNDSIPGRLALPPRGPRRTLALIAAMAAVFSGVYLSTVVLYFTRVVHISSMQVGVGLSVAGVACIAANVLAGRTSDRRGPLLVLRAGLLVAAGGTLAFLTVRGFAMYLVIVPITAAGQAVVQLMISTLISRMVTDRPNEFRAYIRTILNLGMGIGLGLSAVAVQLDSAEFYRVTMVVGAICLLGGTVLVERLPDPGPAAAERNSPADRWIVLRDRPFLALTALDGVLSLQAWILTAALPLWILERTTAPRWAVVVPDLINIALVVCCQIQVSRTIVTARDGATAMWRAGLAFGIALVLMAAARDQPAWVAVTAVAIGAAVLTMGEILQTAGGYELANALAPEHAIGQYLGVFGSGIRLADTVGPLLLMWLCLGLGVLGWCIAAGLLVAAGLMVPRVARWAEATRPARALVPA
ncbi:MFS transporter [Nocardia sp. NPDC127579]|uniref:MFS transporter n=1 Tax=Nocardia sp. NPDC127579 TaxID=3345402 RepID=UPI00363228DF